MPLIEILRLHGPVWKPFVFAVVLYGARYLILATAAFLFTRSTIGARWGRAHGPVPVGFCVGRHVRRELLYSLGTVFVFGLINAGLYGWGLIQHSLLYYRLADYPRWWFWLSIVAMLLLHDALFYWLHRAMHTRWLFRRMHRLHHRSVHPTSFAAYSFHPSEAVGEALIAVLIIYVIPVHPVAYILFQTLSTAYNVYGHCGREFYPAGVASHGLGRWLNTSTAHAAHHGQGRHNYGLYFMIWDRLFRTVDPAYR